MFLCDYPRLWRDKWWWKKTRPSGRPKRAWAFIIKGLLRRCSASRFQKRQVRLGCIGPPVFSTDSSRLLVSRFHMFQQQLVLLHKQFMLDDNRLQVAYRFTAKMPQLFSTEINLAMPSCDGVGVRYIFQGKIPGCFGQSLELTDLTEITLDDDTLGGNIVIKTSSPVTLTGHPHFSVSQSESGFEKIMQALTLRLEWPIVKSWAEFSGMIGFMVFRVVVETPGAVTAAGSIRRW